MREPKHPIYAVRHIAARIVLFFTFECISKELHLKEMAAGKKSHNKDDGEEANPATV